MDAGNTLRSSRRLPSSRCCRLHSSSRGRCSRAWRRPSRAASMKRRSCSAVSSPAASPSTCIMRCAHVTSPTLVGMAAVPPHDFYRTSRGQVAMYTLDAVHPITHAVGNTIKRVILILFSVVRFGTPMTRQRSATLLPRAPLAMFHLTTIRLAASASRAAISSAIPIGCATKRCASVSSARRSRSPASSCTRSPRPSSNRSRRSSKMHTVLTSAQPLPAQSLPCCSCWCAIAPGGTPYFTAVFARHCIGHRLYCTGEPTADTHLCGLCACALCGL